MLLVLAAFFSPSINAQTNTVSGSLINAPGSSSVTIPQRKVTFEFISTDPEFPSTYINANSSTSNTYSLSYTGGPFFISDEARVFVNLGTSAEPIIDFQCVKTDDIVLLNLYRLNLASLSPTQLIAADVNIDGVINEEDDDMLQDVVRGTVDKFTNSISVGGVSYSDRNVVYPTVADTVSLGSPISFSSEYFFDPVPTGTNGNKDFLSIRIGDVNGSCTTYSSLTGDDSVPSTAYSTTKINLILEARPLNQDNSYEVKLKIDDYSKASILSFRLLLDDALTITEVAYPSGRKVKNLPYRISKEGRALTFLSIAEENGLSDSGNSLKEADVLSFIVKSNRGIQDLSKLIQFDELAFDNILVSKEDVSTMSPLELAFIPQDFLNGNEEIIVGPNPFYNTLSVSTGSYKAKNIRILDISGRQLFSQEIENSSQIIQLNSAALSNLTPGAYLLQVIAEDGQSFTRKLTKR